MRLSTRARYGVRFLMELAACDTGCAITLKTVAGRQAISEKYLWQVADPLKKAGLVRTVTGPGGGYTLARNPAGITLLDILCALEGDQALVACTHTPSPCPRGPHCATRALWRDVDKRIADVLRDYTLQELAERQRLLSAGGTGDYAI